jgi:hypothetical protein
MITTRKAVLENEHVRGQIGECKMGLRKVINS